MNFRLIIDKEKEEEVVATVHKRTGVIDEIEALVTGENIQRDSLAAYSEDEIRLLNIDETECITEFSKGFDYLYGYNKYSGYWLIIRSDKSVLGLVGKQDEDKFKEVLDEVNISRIIYK